MNKNNEKTIHLQYKIVDQNSLRFQITDFCLLLISSPKPHATPHAFA